MRDTGTTTGTIFYPTFCREGGREWERGDTGFATLDEAWAAAEAGVADAYSTAQRYGVIAAVTTAERTYVEGFGLLAETSKTVYFLADEARSVGA